jgi:pimeloyl-ACP methyl ester carboxylesterase
VRRRGIIGIAAGVAGLVAAGAAVGVATERYAIGRVRSRPDPEADQPYGQLRPDRTSVVRTDDGIPLEVEEVGPADAPLTVVFVHGLALALGSWHYQWLGLADMTRPRLRMVFYDQRSHGRSGRAPAETVTIDQLGDDLYRVLAEVAPSGPVVLVGHSMGGMAVMSLVDRHPELFGPRVIGVALISTSTGRLSEVSFGLPAVTARLRSPVMPLVLRAMRSWPGLIERGRQVGADLAWLLTRHYSFGSSEVSPALVDYVERLIAGTPVDVVAEFFPALTAHEKLGSLSRLAGLEVLIMVGDKDLLTPEEHSRRMAQLLPHAELLVLDGAGHLAMMERPALVNLRLRAFLHRAYRAAATGSHRGVR